MSLMFYQVNDVISHADYNDTNFDNDIAILRLSTEATLTNYVQPICLWDPNRIALQEVIGKLGIVTGWGVTETDELSSTLRQAVAPVVSQQTCLSSDRPFYGNFITDRNFCANFRNGKFL